MAKTTSKKRWLYVQCLTLLGLLLPVGCYFFIYLPSQQAYFANRDFRLLSVVSDQIKARIENAAKALQNVARTTSTNETSPEARTRIKMALELIPALTLVGVSANPTESKTNLTTSAVGNNTNDWVKFDVEPDVGTSLMNFQYTTTTNAPIVSIKAKADFNNFVAIRPEFDGLLVARQDGSVMFQRSLAGWRVLNLTTLVDTKGQKFATNLLGQSSSLTTVSLAGTDYKVFLQPVQISNNIGGTTNQWWVVGLVRSGRFVAESLAISHKYLVGFILLVLLLAAAFPLIKLQLMGPRERLGKADVFFLMLSTVGGSATLLLLLLNTYTYKKTENTLDDQVKEFGTNITENLNAETAAMYRQLTNFSRSEPVAVTNTAAYAGNTNWIFLTNLLTFAAMINLTNWDYPYFEQVAWVKSDGWQREKWTVRNFPTPFINLKERDYFRDALGQRHSLYEFHNGDTNFWLESILSWNTGESSAIMSITGANEVVYMESKLLSLLRPLVPPGFGFAVVANDGRVLLHSDMERNLQENLLLECDNAPPLRAALMGGTSREPFDVNCHGIIHRFHINPLPGFNWSLAVFRNEYFLDSADFDLLLISLYLFCFYLGLLIVIWLVVFRLILREGTAWLWPDEVKSQCYGQVIWINSLIGLAFVEAMVLVSDPMKSAVVGLAASLLGIILFYWRLKAFCSFKFSVRQIEDLHSFAARLKQRLDGVSEFLWGRFSRKLPCFPDFRINYVLALTSLFLVIAAVPAFAFFRASHDAQMELFVKRGQIHFAKALQERTARVENDYRRIKIGPGDREKVSFLDDRLQITSQSTQHIPWDLYQHCFFDTELELAADEYQKGSVNSKKGHHGDAAEPDFFKTFLAKLRPLHYRTGAETHGLFRETAVDNSYQWGWENDGAVTLTKGHRRLVLHKENFWKSQPLHVHSALPQFFGFQEFYIGSILLVICGMAFCIVVFYLARFIARQVFLLGVNPQPGSEQSARHTLVLGSTRLPAETVSSPSINCSDSEVDQKAQLVKLDVELAKDDPTAKIITLLHFESRFQDAAFNRQKLDLLERFVTEDRCKVRVYSTVDPSHFRVSGPAPKTGRSHRNDTGSGRSRWPAEPMGQPFSLLCAGT